MQQELSSVEQRLSRAVSELEERIARFSSIEDRLHHDAAERLRALERTIEQEWSALRALYQGPAEELQAQAETLGRVSVAAATGTASGLEQAEARLADIEQILRQRLDAVSSRLDQAIAEARTIASRPAAASREGDEVVRLHVPLRGTPEPPPSTTEARTRIPAPARLDAWPPAPVERAAAPEPAQPAVGDHEGDTLDDTAAWRGASPAMRVVIVVGAVLLAASVVGAAMFRRDARAAVARATEVRQQAEAALAAVAGQVSSARDEVARQTTRAREGAERERLVADVLSSPDLMRFIIPGSGPGAAAGQVFLSRSSGVVVSGVRVPKPAQGLAYQLWLLTDAEPMAAGTFTPDETGRVIFAADAPRVTGQVIGMLISVEPAGGSQVPSQRIFAQNRLGRPAPAPAAPDAAPSSTLPR